MVTNPTLVPAPEWIDFRRDKFTLAGKLLASFTVLDGETPLPQTIPKTLSVKKSRFFMKIKILGLRNLESLGVMPIRRPYIRINMNSLKTLDQANSEVQMSNLVTEPKEHGNSPNIGLVLTYGFIHL